MEKKLSQELEDETLMAVTGGTDEETSISNSADGEVKVNQLSVGDNILISKYSGTEVKNGSL
ncbi:MAG: hypothetical protein E7286_09475 [Lachnospiraceae bacterium]|nr:hypothetical protein [Lachnospiraceae bacterium]